MNAISITNEHNNGGRKQIIPTKVAYLPYTSVRFGIGVPIRIMNMGAHIKITT
jgi:hypothetical protein